MIPLFRNCAILILWKQKTPSCSEKSSKRATASFTAWIATRGTPHRTYFSRGAAAAVRAIFIRHRMPNGRKTSAPTWDSSTMASCVFPLCPARRYSAYSPFSKHTMPLCRYDMETPRSILGDRRLRPCDRNGLARSRTHVLRDRSIRAGGTPQTLARRDHP